MVELPIIFGTYSNFFLVKYNGALLRPSVPRARNVSREDNSDVMGDNCAVMKLRSYKKSQDGNVSPSQLELKLFCNTACDWSELASQLY